MVNGRVTICAAAVTVAAATEPNRGCRRSRRCRSTSEEKSGDLTPPENHCGHPNFRFNAIVYINSKPIDDI